MEEWDGYDEDEGDEDDDGGWWGVRVFVVVVVCCGEIIDWRDMLVMGELGKEEVGIGCLWWVMWYMIVWIGGIVI